MYLSSLLVEDSINTITSCQSISMFLFSSRVRSCRLVILAFALRASSRTSPPLCLYPSRHSCYPYHNILDGNPISQPLP